ncbi:MAG: T9SS type A sorting domain-containing protein [Sphingobacteriales bacterium]|nr:MAG: T9SS type A sorting domain-containing protein [Sphingobacteriales bacterium]
MYKKLLLVVLAVFSATGSFGQSKNFWASVSADKARTAGEIKTLFDGTTGTFFTLDQAGMKAALAGVSDRSSGNGVIIAVPNLEGKTEHFRVFEYSNFSPELQAQYPEIRAYAGTGIEDPSANLRFSFSPKGIQTMILRANRATEFIEPYTTNSNVYIAFKSTAKREKGKLQFTCHTQDDGEVGRLAIDGHNHRDAMSSTMVFKKFRLALSCTGEYGAYHGGTVAGALAAMNATMTRVNGVYEIDLAVKLEIIANNNVIVYTNAGTDPYSPANTGANGDWSGELQVNLNNVIGAPNYDIGHLFGASGGGGFAGCIGCICNNANKGSAFTSPGAGGPEGDAFDIDYVAHEMGHQLGANHTYSVANEQTGVNVEPGSGSTIMAYAGITGPATDVQSNSDDYFTYRSILQIQNNLQNKACAVNTTLTNTPMTINAGADYTIPRGTAFILKATGAAANGANVTYNWEQNDTATNASAGNNSVVTPNKTTGPTFRSVPPSTSPDRFMPALNTVLNNSLTGNWETVSNVARNLNFTLTGRDNVAGGGQTKTDAMVVTVNAATGPFTVTSQNTDGIVWMPGQTQNITWNVAGTTGAPINTANVNILMSTDNGQTFTTVLAANTPNDGNETITVPNAIAPFCRIKIEAVGNIYYAVNQRTFSNGFQVTNICNTYTNANSVAIPDAATAFSTSVISVPGGSNVVISDVNVGINITHPYVADLTLIAVSPNNTQVILWQEQCGSNDNINAVFDDSGANVTCTAINGNIRATGTLSSFNGQNSAGNWLLGFIDPYAQDAGTLNSWSVQICSQTLQQLSNNDFSLENFTLYPNPNKGSFTVEFNADGANEVKIAIHDMRGRQVYNKSYQNSGLFSGNIQMGSIQTGVYMVTVENGGRKVVKKIVVE